MSQLTNKGVWSVLYIALFLVECNLYSRNIVDWLQSVSSNLVQV